ncbi:MAG: phage-related protein [Lysobacterales bacterium]|jgi:phage-related protein
MGRNKRIKNDTLLIGSKLEVDFYQSDSGRQPARDWLQGLDTESRKRLGQAIRSIQMSWPVGMPLVRKFKKDLWEMRTRLPNGICRIFFTVYQQKLVLLHGLAKKSQATPLNELDLVSARLLDFRTRMKL